jgi:hypothetical protein
MPAAPTIMMPRITAIVAVAPEAFAALFVVRFGHSGARQAANGARKTRAVMDV